MRGYSVLWARLGARCASGSHFRQQIYAAQTLTSKYPQNLNLRGAAPCRKTTPEQRRRWDLSNLQFIMSGAEPIRAETMGAFFGAFAVSGLKASVFCSAYGLAEHVCGAFPPPERAVPCCSCHAQAPAAVLEE